jgi:hypothetical protein
MASSSGRRDGLGDEARAGGCRGGRAAFLRQSFVDWVGQTIARCCAKAFYEARRACRACPAASQPVTSSVARVRREGNSHYENAPQ